MLDDVGVANEAEDVVENVTLLIPVLDADATVLEVEDVEFELTVAAIRDFPKRRYHKSQLESAVQEAGPQHYMSKQHRP
jgi:hypothetical protein